MVKLRYTSPKLSNAAISEIRGITCLTTIDGGESFYAQTLLVKFICPTQVSSKSMILRLLLTIPRYAIAHFYLSIKF